MQKGFYWKDFSKPKYSIRKSSRQRNFALFVKHVFYCRESRSVEFSFAFQLDKVNPLHQRQGVFSPTAKQIARGSKRGRICQGYRLYDGGMEVQLPFHSMETLGTVCGTGRAHLGQRACPFHDVFVLLANVWRDDVPMMVFR